MKAIARVWEFLILTFLCTLFSLIQGTIQHYLAFGTHGYGFGLDSLQLALLEGGTLGAMVGVPVGLIIYYPVLRRSVDSSRVLKICGAVLVGGSVAGILLGRLSVFVTPLLAFGTAWQIKHKRIVAES